MKYLRKKNGGTKESGKSMENKLGMVQEEDKMEKRNLVGGR